MPTIRDERLIRLQALVRKALDKESTDPERDASARALCVELEKIAFLEAKALGVMLDVPEAPPQPPVWQPSDSKKRRRVVEVDPKRPPFVRPPPPPFVGHPFRPGPRSEFVDFDPPAFGKNTKRRPR